METTIADVIKVHTELLAGIATALFAWALAQLSHWYKGMKEDNRIRKEVLFCLLDVYESIPRLNIQIEQVLKRGMDNLYSKLPFDNEEEKIITVNALMVQLKPLITKIIDERFSAIAGKYNTAIIKLSAVNPIMSYRLAGRTEILKHTNSVTDELKTLLAVPSQADPAITGMLTEYLVKETNTTFEETSTFFKSQIKALSLKVGLLTWIKILLLLKKLNKNPILTDEDINESIDRYCDFVLKMIFDQYNKKQALANVQC